MKTGLPLWSQSPENYRDVATRVEHGDTPCPISEKPTKPVTCNTYAGYRVFVQRVRNALGHAVTTVKDLGTGQLLASQGPNPYQLTMTTYDGLGRPLSVETKGQPGRESRLVEVARTAYVDGSTTIRPRVTQETRTSWAGAWSSVETETDASGRPLFERTNLAADGLGNAVRTFAYDSVGNLTDFTVPPPHLMQLGLKLKNVRYRFRYDSLGRKIESVSPPDSSGVAAGVVTVFDGPTTTIHECVVLTPDDPCVWDVGTAALSEATVLATKQLTNDAFGRLTEVAEMRDGGEWAMTQYRYDARDTMVEITDAEGFITELEHDPVGNRIAITRAGKTWRYQYDFDGKMLARIEPHPSGVSDIRYRTTIAYDALGRVTSHMPALRDMTESEKREFGTSLVVTSYDTAPNGVGAVASQRTYGFRSDGGSAGRTPLRLWTDYIYDGRGNVADLTRGFDLRAAGTPLSDERTVSRTYNPQGQPLDVWYGDAKDANERTHIGLSYDSRGLPLEATWTRPPAGPPPAVTCPRQNSNTCDSTEGCEWSVSAKYGQCVNFSARCNSRRRRSCGSSWLSSCRWDSSARSCVPRWSTGRCGADSNPDSCDSNGECRWNGSRTNGTCSPDGTEPAATAYRLARFERNAAGNVFSIRGNAGRRGVQYSYDALGRVTSHTVTQKTSFFKSPKTLMRQDFNYGATGEVATTRSAISGLPTRTMSYDYDLRHQLVNASDNHGFDATYDYGVAGRLLSTTVIAPDTVDAHPRDVAYEYGGTDPEAVTRLKVRNGSAAVAEYAYDDAGNVIARTECLESPGLCDRTSTFRYDGNLRQSKAVGPEGASELYYYDAGGQRSLAVRKSSSGAVNRVRFWFGATEIWYDGGGTETKSWVSVAHGAPIARIENRTALEFTHHSVLGHMLVATDDTGVIKGGFNYGPFGEILDQVGTPEEHLRRFNGKDADQLSGLSYYGFRYYDPLSLTWSQADPLFRFTPEFELANPRTENLYVFTLANAMRYLDPNGLFSVCGLFGICAAEKAVTNTAKKAGVTAKDIENGPLGKSVRAVDRVLRETSGEASGDRMMASAKAAATDSDNIGKHVQDMVMWQYVTGAIVSVNILLQVKSARSAAKVTSPGKSTTQEALAPCADECTR